MNSIVEQIALDKNISRDDAAYILKVVSNHLIYKVSALQPVIQDIFDNAETELLRDHLKKMIVILQKENIETFKTWQMPAPAKTMRSFGSDRML